MMEAKEKLLQAAERCLLEKGSHATSIKAVAATAGVNHGLIHHYFGSKEGLFIELAKKHLKTTAPPSTLDEEEVVRFLKETVALNSRMMIELRALSFHMPELNRVLVTILTERRKNIRNILNLDEEETNLLMATVAGLGFQSGLDLSLDMELYLRRVFRLIVRDILPQAGKGTQDQ